MCHSVGKFGVRNFMTFTVKGILYYFQVTLVVNVASACGFTDSHYKALIRLKNVLSTTNKFEILAFPCNQFGAQEPGVCIA